MEVESTGNKPVEKPVEKKKWVILFASLGIAIIGLVIAIAVVAIVKNNTRTGDDSNTSTGEMTEAERKKKFLKEAEDDYMAVSEAINKVVSYIEVPDQSELISTYEYYIGQAESEYAKAMLQSDLLLILMGYDTDKIKGDELIDEAKAVDEILGTPNSAALIMNLASAYDKTELYEEYEKILIQREIDSGYDIEMETEG